MSAPTTFIEKLLAPLPKGEKKADSAAFRRQLRKDAKFNPYAEPWRRIHFLWRAAKHDLDAARCRAASDCAASQTAEERHNFTAFVQATDRMMQTPAPDKTELKHKKSWRKLDGGRPEWETCIAADEARLLGVKGEVA